IRPLSEAPAALSAAVRRSARPGAAATVAAPAAILLNAERREIFVFIVLAQVEFCGEYTPRSSAGVKQESHHRVASELAVGKFGERGSVTRSSFSRMGP